MLRGLVFAALIAATAAPSAWGAGGLVIYAAASLQPAMGDVAALWQRTGHAAPQFVFASSAVLAKRIIEGEHADIMCSTDREATAALERHGDVVPGSRRTLYGNSLVLAARQGSFLPAAITSEYNFFTLLGPEGKIAIGDPQFVFGGKIAQQALQRLGQWDRVRDRMVLFSTVRLAVAALEKGEVRAAIAFATDAQSSARIGVIGAFPAASHDPIRYAFMAINGGDAAQSRLFISFLDTQPARDIFTQYGFTPP